MTNEGASQKRDSRYAAVVKSSGFTVLVPGTVAFWLPLSSAHLHFREQPPIAVFIGGAVTGCGAGLLLVCIFREFAWRSRGTPAPRDAPEVLVVSGPYCYLRNPMYAGVLACIAGEAVPLRSFALVLYLAVVLVGFNIFILGYEEPELRRRFGASYEAYCCRVPRWIPRRR